MSECICMYTLSRWRARTRTWMREWQGPGQGRSQVRRRTEPTPRCRSWIFGGIRSRGTQKKRCWRRGGNSERDRSSPCSTWTAKAAQSRPVRRKDSVLVFSRPQLLFQSSASLSMLLDPPPQTTNVAVLTHSLFTINYRTHALTAGAARRRLGEPPGRQRRGRPSRHPAPCRPRRAAESPWDPTACAS